MKRILLFAVAAIICLASFTVKAQETVSPNGMNYTQASYADHSAEQDFGDAQLVLGYVNKSWVCAYQSETQREDYFGYQNSYLHGFQIGGLYTPVFGSGFGIRTGLFLEFYFASPSWMREYCDGFQEFDLYIPLQANYRCMFNDEFGFNIFAGPAFQWAADGEYYKYKGSGTSWGWSGHWWGPRRYDYYDTHKAAYGNGWPERVNWQIDLGLSFRLKSVELGFQYSFGLNDHKIENTTTNETASPARQDKMQAWISFAF